MGPYLLRTLAEIVWLETVGAQPLQADAYVSWDKVEDEGCGHQNETAKDEGRRIASHGRSRIGSNDKPSPILP